MITIIISFIIGVYFGASLLCLIATSRLRELEVELERIKKNEKS